MTQRLSVYPRALAKTCRNAEGIRRLDALACIA